MKIRNGFVSNSSSSSFMIYGVALDKNDFIKKMKESVPELESGDVYPAMGAVSKSTDLSAQEGPDYWEMVYIGKSWDSVKDDETGKQFKESVKNDLEKLGITDICTTHEEGWYDG